MLIERIEIKNFRSLKNLDVACERLTAIVGRNGTGKSSILYALEAFYDPGASITTEDFFSHDPTAYIEIRVTYTGLRPNEREEFRPYINDDRLIVTKRFSEEGGKIVQRYYGAALQLPEFSELRPLGRRDKLARWKQLVTTATLPGLEPQLRTGDEVDAAMAAYEDAHPEQLQPIEREEQFFGPRNIGGGKLDKFTRFVLVPAVRDASAEADRKGIIPQLIETIVLRRINARSDVQEFRQEFERRVKEVFSPENLTELKELASSISTLLSRYAPGAQLDLSWGEAELPRLQIPSAKPSLSEEDFRCSINRSGHGVQRALILTLLQHLALTPTTRLPSSAAEPEASSEGVTPSAPASDPDLILAIEEPELYLHPARCRYLSTLLLQLATPTAEVFRGRNQILYATHSPYFVDLARFDQVRFARRVRADEDTVSSCRITSFTKLEAAKRLAEISGRDASEFSAAGFEARATNVMTVLVNEGFFADKVLVVEGASELGILWKLQEILEKAWHVLGVVIAPASGKENVDRPVVVFRGFEIPTYFIFDGDSSTTGKARDQAKRRNQRYLRLAGAKEEDFPATQVKPKWAVFEEDIEGEIKKALGMERFQRILRQVADELGYDPSADVLKNAECAARFVGHAYGEGLRISILEEIVERVTEM